MNDGAGEDDWTSAGPDTNGNPRSCPGNCGNSNLFRPLVKDMVSRVMCTGLKGIPSCCEPNVLIFEIFSKTYTASGLFIALWKAGLTGVKLVGSRKTLFFFKCEKATSQASKSDRQGEMKCLLTIFRPGSDNCQGI